MKGDSRLDGWMLDHLDDVVLVFDGEGRLREWNDRFTAVTDTPATDLAGTTAAELFDGDGTRVRRAIDRAREGETGVDVDIRVGPDATRPFAFTFHARDGEDRTESVVAIGQEVRNGEGSEDGAWTVLNRMADGFFALDTDWQITYINEAGATILSEAMGRDRSREELQGVHLWQEIPEAVDTTFYERYHEAMETQEPALFEEFYDPLDRWFEVRAYPSETGLSVYLHDTTERRRQREQLAHRQQVLQRMYAITADRQRPFEEQVTALLELGREELGTGFGTLSRIEGEEYVFEIVDADDDSIEAGDVVPVAATNCEIAARTEETLVLGDVARDAPDETDRAGYTDWGIACYIGAPVFVGEDVYGTFCFYGTESREGQFSDWEVTLVDLMGQWVSYELHQRQTTRRLERQNEKLERFASVVSHDLRNPLNVVEGSVALARETGDPSELDRADRAIERMNALISDLLALARAGETVSDPTDIDLASLLERCWNQVDTGEATLDVETERTIHADETRVRQLLENLVRNAVEHGGPDVTVTVGDLEGGFYVADDGAGIPADERADVLESGYTTSEEGTGLGLAIVAEIADACGWDLAVSESASGGARFEFTGVS